MAHCFIKSAANGCWNNLEHKSLLMSIEINLNSTMTTKEGETLSSHATFSLVCRDCQYLFEKFTMWCQNDGF
jgi:hypothetical protein